MTVQEIHEYIWNGVIHAFKSKKHMRKHGVRYVFTDADSDWNSTIAYHYTNKVKRAVIQKMYDNEMISREAYEALMTASDCVLCAAYNERCEHCPLGYHNDNGCVDVYCAVMFKHNIDAAREIRDIDVQSGYAIDKSMVRVLES